jgi:hypothetical protein
VRQLAAASQRPLAGGSATSPGGLRGLAANPALVALGRPSGASFQLANPLTAAQTGSPDWGSIRGSNIKKFK